jgi:hypothetical protein
LPFDRVTFHLGLKLLTESTLNAFLQATKRFFAYALLHSKANAHAIRPNFERCNFSLPKFCVKRSTTFIYFIYNRRIIRMKTVFFNSTAIKFTLTSTLPVNFKIQKGNQILQTLSFQTNYISSTTLNWIQIKNLLKYHTNNYSPFSRAESPRTSVYIANKNTQKVFQVPD